MNSTSNLQWFSTFICDIDVKKLINNYGAPSIDYLHFFRKRYTEKFHKDLETKLENDYSEYYYTYFSPYIQWNIMDENNEQIALIYIEFYFDYNSSIDKYPERNHDFECLFKQIVNSSFEVKQKFIHDFISLSYFNQNDYPSLTYDITEFCSDLDYLHSNYTQWYILTKDNDIFNKLCNELNFKYDNNSLSKYHKFINDFNP